MTSLSISSQQKKLTLSAETDQPALCLYDNDRQIASFKISELLRFSTEKPWAMLHASCQDISFKHEMAAASAETPAKLTSAQVVNHLNPDSKSTHDSSENFCSEKIVIKLPKAFTGLSAELVVFFDDVYGLVFNASWHNQGPSLPHAMAGLSFSIPQEASKMTLPHCIYNDNPSADANRVIPKIGKTPGKGYIAEEHRLPIPGVNLQWPDDGSYPYLSVFTRPSCVNQQFDRVWSLGLIKQDAGYAAVSYSGGVMYNGKKDWIYAAQGQGLPYDHSYNEMHVDATWEKTLYLHWGNEYQEGWGFRSLFQHGWSIYKPVQTPAMTLDQLISLKRDCLDTRWHEDSTCSGYTCFGSANEFGNLSGRPEYFLYAWTGESLKLAWSDILYGLKENKQDAVKRGLSAADFFVRESIQNDFGMPGAYYLWEEKKWGGAWYDNDSEFSTRMTGCSTGDLVDIMNLLKDNDQTIPAAWASYITDVCHFLMQPERLTKDGLYPLKWDKAGRPVSDIMTSAGIPGVIALTKAGAYLDRQDWIDYAAAIMERYYQYIAKTMDRPFAHATLDASCEDKEAGMYFFIAAMALYQVVHDKRYLAWAGMALDWIITFVYLWEPGLYKGSPCEEAGFKVSGWPGVSVQNHHLDVYFPLIEMDAYANATGDQRYAACARLTLDAWSHGVCVQPGDFGFTVPGEQGEQYFQTNFSQAPDSLNRQQDWRGGMARWHPSWIIAEVLSAGLYYKYKDQA